MNIIMSFGSRPKMILHSKKIHFLPRFLVLEKFPLCTLTIDFCKINLSSKLLSGKQLGGHPFNIDLRSCLVGISTKIKTHMSVC